MEMWHPKHECCANCGTTRRRYKTRGYCSKCYPLVLRIERTRKWDSKKPETLGGYPRDGIFWRPGRFDQVKAGFLRQLEERLSSIEFWERKYEGPILGIDLEYQLKRIARLAGARDTDLHYGLASCLADDFGPEQRLALFQLLHEIEESVPWSGIDYGKLFDD